jgi:hypothetical protein
MRHGLSVEAEKEAVQNPPTE